MLKHIPFYGVLLQQTINGKQAGHTHVLLYGAIEAHSMGPKGCIASNKQLAEDTGLSTSRVQSLLSEISQAGWVQVVLDNDNHRLQIVPQAFMVRQGGLAERGTPPLPNAATENTVENTVGISVESHDSPPRHIYELYVRLFKHNPNQLKLTPKRTKMLRARLKDCGEEMCAAAIAGAAADPFYNGENDRQWHGTIDYLFRSYETVEKYAYTKKEKSWF